MSPTSMARRTQICPSSKSTWKPAGSKRCVEAVSLAVAVALQSSQALVHPCCRPHLQAWAVQNYNEEQMRSLQRRQQEPATPRRHQEPATSPGGPIERGCPTRASTTTQAKASRTRSRERRCLPWLRCSCRRARRRARAVAEVPMEACFELIYPGMRDAE